MYIFAHNPLFQAYQEADLFGKGIFIALFLLSLSSWIVLHQKILVQKQFYKAGQHLHAFLIKNRNTPLALEIRPELNPFNDLYFTLKRGALELIDRNRVEHQHNTPFLSKEDIASLETLFCGVMPKYHNILNRNNFIPATIITLAPFLGLLGTVWGILLTFTNLQPHNMQMMNGLSTALGTTILGLIVTIPSLIAHNYVKSQAHHLLSEIEHTAYLLINSIELRYRKK